VGTISQINPDPHAHGTVPVFLTSLAVPGVILVLAWYLYFRTRKNAPGKNSVGSAGVQIATSITRAILYSFLGIVGLLLLLVASYIFFGK
jgi:hypothetical protein